MTEPTRSLGIGYPTASWEDLPRWQRLVAFWAALLLAAGFCLKIGQFETLFILLLAVQAGRLSSTLFELKPGARRSAEVTSITGKG